MKTLLMSALAASLTVSCATQKNTVNEFKSLTENVDRCNPGEIVLAQALYNKMKPLKKN